MNYFNTYFMKPVIGILTKKGADISALLRPTANLPFVLHSFSRGNATTTRRAGYLQSSGILYHRSRSMGGY